MSRLLRSCGRTQADGKLGRDLLRQVGTLFSPETLLKWHRWLVARKYDGSDRRAKRGPAPTKANMIRKLVLRMAQENPSWGYGRINGELKKLGYDVHWQTVRRVMLDHGLLPDPDKPYETTWKTFIQSHWDSIAACDFLTEHHNLERPHKGLGYCRPVEPDSPLTTEGEVKCHERLGGPLKSYYREAGRSARSPSSAWDLAEQVDEHAARTCDPAQAATGKQEGRSLWLPQDRTSRRAPGWPGRTAEVAWTQPCRPTIQAADGINRDRYQRR